MTPYDSSLYAETVWEQKFHEPTLMTSKLQSNEMKLIVIDTG